MRADPRFSKQPKPFWANVRSISQELGYTARKTGQIKVYSQAEMAHAMAERGLDVAHLSGPGGPTAMGALLETYFAYRAKTLNEVVQPLLMDAPEARALFESQRTSLNPTCPLPSNKQTGEKAGPALLTGIVNMLIEANAGGCSVEYDPKELTTFTRDGAPLRTLARRVDGCLPKAVNPVAVWEIKEYYHTTTFGSRVADGVYETLLDGMELEELLEHEGVACEHVLIADSRYTWWTKGRSYLCRIIDMLNMGYVDEVLFGKEVLDRLPVLVKEWAAKATEAQ